MSVLQAQTASLVPFIVAITGSTVVTVVDGDVSGNEQAVIVPKMWINQTADTALNLTVDLYDGTNTRYLGAFGSTWNSKAMANKMSVEFEDIIVPKDWKLRVTSSNASGLLHVYGLKVRAQ